MIIQRPIVEFVCPTCGATLRVEGGQIVVCCGFQYAVTLTIHQESSEIADRRLTDLREQIRALQKGPPL